MPNESHDLLEIYFAYTGAQAQSFAHHCEMYHPNNKNVGNHCSSEKNCIFIQTIYYHLNI